MRRTPGIPVADTGTSVSLRLDLCDCQVDAVIAESYSGAALLMVDLAEDTIFSTPVLGPPVASAVVHGSRMRCRFPLGETALGFAFAEAYVTGNIVAERGGGPSPAHEAHPGSYSLRCSDGHAARQAGPGRRRQCPHRPRPRLQQAWDPLNTSSA